MTVWSTTRTPTFELWRVAQKHLQNRSRFRDTGHCRVFNESTRHFNCIFEEPILCLLPKLYVQNYFQRYKWNLDPDVMLLYFDLCKFNCSAWMNVNSVTTVIIRSPTFIAKLRLSCKTIVCANYIPACQICICAYQWFSNVLAEDALNSCITIPGTPSSIIIRRYKNATEGF